MNSDSVMRSCVPTRKYFLSHQPLRDTLRLGCESGGTATFKSLVFPVRPVCRRALTVSDSNYSLLLSSLLAGFSAILIVLPDLSGAYTPNASQTPCSGLRQTDQSRSLCAC